MLLLTLFISAFLTVIMVNFGFWPALCVAIGIAIMNPRVIRRYSIKIPNQQSLLNAILALKIEKYSDEIIGTYKDNPIHDYVIAKNPANDVSYRYDYIDIILYNEFGQILVGPKVGEIFLPTGLIYKDSGVVYTS
jgi:hypothetical protein